MKHTLTITAYAVCFIIGTVVCMGETNPKSLKYLGNSFIKLTTSEGKIIYIDPYAFSQPDSADIILITHEHSDHNDLTRVIPKASCIVIRTADAIKEGVYQSFTIGNISITAVPAYNQYHPKDSGVGYIVEFDSIKIYHAGGTGKIPEMSDLADKQITFALLPLTPGPEIMTEAAAMIHAKRDVPMHTVVSLDSAYNMALVARFTSPNKLIVLPNKTILLNANAALHNGSMLLVPEVYPTIQSAIDMAQNGDTVLVSEGTYFENISYKGKGIVVTSKYFITQVWQTVLNTVIDGSTCANKDTASVVQFLHGEDSTAVLDGFTITGGNGTRYSFGSFWHEGAGVIMSYSSAIVRNNFIHHNITKPQGTTRDGGGGGIASMFGNPTIYHNVIFSNTSGYAGGIVLNWSNGIIRNNIIYHNSCRSLGAGGVMLWKTPIGTTILENNTIFGNISSTNGGGIINNVDNPAAIPVIRNNIVWGNRQATGGQITNPEYIHYNNVEDYSGGTNISSIPLFDSAFVLSALSPCVDAGDSSGMSGDNENPLNAGSALFPAQGTLRNDIGAYGGPLAKILPSIVAQKVFLSTTAITLIRSAPTTGEVKIALANLSNSPLKVLHAAVNDTNIFSIKGNLTERVFGILEQDTLTLTYSPDTSGIFYDTIKIVYESPLSGKPPYFSIPIKLTVRLATGVDETEAAIPGEFRLHQNYPNPFNPNTEIRYQISEVSRVALKVYDAIGREVATLVNEVREAGSYSATFNASNFASGIYFARLQSNGKQMMKKMLLMK